jgi:hypothetical protein
MTQAEIIIELHELHRAGVAALGREDFRDAIAAQNRIGELMLRWQALRGCGCDSTGPYHCAGANVFAHCGCDCHDLIHEVRFDQ